MKTVSAVLAATVLVAGSLWAQGPSTPYREYGSLYPNYPYAPYSGYSYYNYAYPYGGPENWISGAPRGPAYDPSYHADMSPFVGGGKGLNVDRAAFYSNPRYRAHIDEMLQKGYRIRSWY